MTPLIASLLTALILPFSSQSPAPGAALRIVVVQGEDAVNIIQQKTAVAPIVEVRDRNNLPVSGVTVTFTVARQGASFGGLSTLTVTTNAAGQAAAAGLTPTAAGAIQINATALVQGQALTATITQTNVLTAAQAAGAAGATGGASGASGGGGGAGAGGAAAGGGGGVSATTLGIVGAAVAGGALVATQVGRDKEDGLREFGGPFSGQLSIVFSACTRVHEISGTLTIEINNLNGPFTGTAHVGGTSRVIAFSSGNCPNGPQIGTSEPMGVSPFPISGTTPAISFTKSESNTVPAPFPNQPSSLNTVEFTFTGTLSGDSITGTLTQSVRGETAGAPSGVGSARYTVTLRPN